MNHNPCGLSTEPAAEDDQKVKRPPIVGAKLLLWLIGDAGAMRNGDGQTAAHVGIRNSGKTVETLGEVMIRIERHLVEGARAGTAETGCGRAGRRNTEVVLHAADTRRK